MKWKSPSHLFLTEILPWPSRTVCELHLFFGSAALGLV